MEEHRTAEAKDVKDAKLSVFRVFRGLSLNPEQFNFQGTREISYENDACSAGDASWWTV